MHLDYTYRLHGMRPRPCTGLLDFFKAKCFDFRDLVLKGISRVLRFYGNFETFFDKFWQDFLKRFFVFSLVKHTKIFAVIL
jgi:hypothetical protein